MLPKQKKGEVFHRPRRFDIADWRCGLAAHDRPLECSALCRQNHFFISVSSVNPSPHLPLPLSTISGKGSASYLQRWRKGVDHF
ncbi:hypothetical protein TNCV_4253081 [Trichonephila clavipes]|nr:hypothetical protein TNCV_4253081 [Trichonephila clavipes]